MSATSGLKKCLQQSFDAVATFAVDVLADAAPLTKREVFAAPFHTALFTGGLAEPRVDCPTELPTPLSHRELSQLGPLNGARPLSGLQVRGHCVNSGGCSCDRNIGTAS